MRSVMTKHTENTMSPTIAASTKTMIASNAGSLRRRLDQLRFGAGIAVAMGGAGVLLSNLISLASSLG